MHVAARAPCSVGTAAARDPEDLRHKLPHASPRLPQLGPGVFMSQVGGVLT